MKKKKFSIWWVVLVMLGYVLVSAIFGDWENFKRGVNGDPPKEVHVTIK